MREDAIYMQVAAGSVENLKPSLVMEAFLRFLTLPQDEIEKLTFSYHRLEMYALSPEQRGKSPEDTGKETPSFISLEALGEEIPIERR